MSEFSVQKITYKELKENTYRRYDDRYHIASFLTETVRAALISCPGNISDDKTAMYFLIEDGVVIGREMRYGCKLLINGELRYAQSGGALEVYEPYRVLGIGAEIFLDNVMNDEYELKIGCLYSSMMIPILKKMRFSVFDIPQYVKLRNPRFFLKAKGFKGLWLPFAEKVIMSLLKLLDIKITSKKRKLLKKYRVIRNQTIPLWVEQITLCGNYKYREVHDVEWFQWNLDHNLNGHILDKQSFYSVIDSVTDEPLGFFMTKERYEEKSGIYSHVLRGTVVEWGSFNEDKLSEIDINVIALSTFSPNVSHVSTVTLSDETKRELKKMGYRQHGFLQMAFKDKSGQNKAASDMSQWRIRYGCCNSIIY